MKKISTEENAEKIARWIFQESFLDPEDESWNSRMFDAVKKQIQRILEEPTAE